MHQLIVRLCAALLTFAVGIAASNIFSIIGAWYTSEPDLPIIEEAPIPRVELSCYPGISIPTPATASDSYFPSLKLSDNEYSDQFAGNWYSGQLRAMNESPMYSPDHRRLESYRFLWLRSFHHPVAVRIWKCGTDRCISVKEADGAGGYEPGRLIVNHTRILATAEWDEFMRRLEEACYWNLPTREDDRGFDGANWILEGVKGGRYHIVDRWSPQSGSYRELCLYALALSGLEVASRDQY